jgi:hypothetical protein
MLSRWAVDAVSAVNAGPGADLPRNSATAVFFAVSYLFVLELAMIASSGRW